MDWQIGRLVMECTAAHRRDFESQRERLIGLMQGFVRDFRMGESAKGMTPALIEIAATAKECFRLEEELFSQSNDSNKSRERQKVTAHYAIHQSILADINLALKQVSYQTAAADINSESSRPSLGHCIDALIMHMAREGHPAPHGVSAPAAWPAKH